MRRFLNKWQSYSGSYKANMFSNNQTCYKYMWAWLTSIYDWCNRVKQYAFPLIWSAQIIVFLNPYARRTRFISIAIELNRGRVTFRKRRNTSLAEPWRRQHFRLRCKLFIVNIFSIGSFPKQNPHYFHNLSEIFQQQNSANLITIFAIYDKKIITSRFIQPENVWPVFSIIFSFTFSISPKRFITAATCNATNAYSYFMMSENIIYVLDCTMIYLSYVNLTLQLSQFDE